METSAVAGSASFYERQSRRLKRFRADRQRRLERRRLLARLPDGAVCAEIGTWRGDFAAQILSSARPLKLHLIDPWQHREEETYERAMFGGSARDGQQEMEAIYQGVLDRFRVNIDRGQVELHRSRSLEAAATFPDGALDWAYIDGDHTYEAVKADLEAYYRTVKPGGFLAGDDYGEPGWWEDGVTRAVDEFAAASELTVIGSQFLLRKPS